MFESLTFYHHHSNEFRLRQGLERVKNKIDQYPYHKEIAIEDSPSTRVSLRMRVYTLLIYFLIFFGLMALIINYQSLFIRDSWVLLYSLAHAFTKYQLSVSIIIIIIIIIIILIIIIMMILIININNIKKFITYIEITSKSFNWSQLYTPPYEVKAINVMDLNLIYMIYLSTSHLKYKNIKCEVWRKCVNDAHLYPFYDSNH